MGEIQNGSYISQYSGDKIDELLTTTVWQSNKNLIDNAFFIGGGSQSGKGNLPINQRENTSFSGGSFVYTIDRWMMYTVGNTVSLTAGGLSIPATAQATPVVLRQRIEPGKMQVGEQYTISSLASTGLKTITFTYDGTRKSQSGFVIDPSTDYISVEFWFQNAPACTLYAVKLELGTQQTLAHNEGTDAAPDWVLNEHQDYGEELAKCQRYQLKLSPFQRHRACLVTYSGGTLQFFIPTPVTLRTLPSAASLSSLVLESIPYSDNLPEGYSFSASGLAENGFFISATKSGGSELRDGALRMNGIIIDANL